MVKRAYLREALKLADAMSPCVLWLDEIEKGMAQDGNDNGVSQRLLGTLLMDAERRPKVFIVATSNDIRAMTLAIIICLMGRTTENDENLLFFVMFSRWSCDRNLLLHPIC